MLTETNAIVANTTEANDVIISSTAEDDVITSTTAENDVTMSTTEGNYIKISTIKENNAIKSTAQFTMTEPDNLLEFLSPLGEDECIDELKRFRPDSYEYDTLCFCRLYREHCREHKYRNMDLDIFLQLHNQRFPSFYTKRNEGRTVAFRAFGIVLAAVGTTGESFCLNNIFFFTIVFL